MDQYTHKRFEINKSTRFLAALLSLKNQKVIFFIGAGVPSASGLPLGNALRDNILSKLYPEYPWFARIDEFRKSFYPDQEEITLEMVLQQFGQRFGYEGINDFLESFFNKIKEPSLSHEFLASLSRKKYVSLILLTNFDNLLEEALKRENVDFRVIYNRSEFVSIDQDLGRKVILWKLHGSLENPRSLSATREDVLRFPDKKQNALRWIFENYNIVFVGYSMRDPDILEVINKIDPRDKKYSFFWVSPGPIDKTTHLHPC